MTFGFVDISMFFITRLLCREVGNPLCLQQVDLKQNQDQHLLIKKNHDKLSSYPSLIQITPMKLNDEKYLKYNF